MSLKLTNNYLSEISRTYLVSENSSETASRFFDYEKIIYKYDILWKFLEYLFYFVSASSPHHLPLEVKLDVRLTLVFYSIYLVWCIIRHYSKKKSKEIFVLPVHWPYFEDDVRRHSSYTHLSYKLLLITRCVLLDSLIIHPCH